MKKAIVLFSAIAAVSLAQASELWWTVNGTVDVQGEGGGTGLTWDHAALYASANGYNYGGTQIGDAVTAADMADWGFWNSNIDGYGSSYSFYVELYNSSNESIGKSYVSLDAPKQGAIAYNTLNNAPVNAIYDGNLMNPTASAYSFNQFTTSDVIPEPSSGLMMLIGMIALGLKRKKV